MSFEDLLLPEADVIAGEFIPYVVDTTFYYPLAVIDVDNSLMKFASGYTAVMTLNLANDTDVLRFTHVLTEGRQVDLNPSLSGASLVIRSTPDGMAAVEPYVRRPLAFNLIVTRTSDGMAVDLMRECYIVPSPDYD